MTEQIEKAVAGAGQKEGICATVIKRTYERTSVRRVALAECTIDVDGCLTIDYIGATLGYANFNARLIEDGILDLDGMPYLHYLDCGFFALAAMVLVTPEGQEWMVRRYPPTVAALAAASVPVH